MANYFNNFPLTFYTLDDRGTNLDTVTNIISRFKFQSALEENAASFYRYDVKDSDTPESIATKYYNDPEKHWIVLMFNNIIDPQYDWPLNYSNFIKYVNEKYSANGAANTTVQSGITWAQSPNNVHSYYKITTRASTVLGPDNRTISEKIRITADVYANVSTGNTVYTLSDGKKIRETITKEKLTYYEYEMQENENKRSIKLLKPQFVAAVMEEFRQLVNPS
jgi:hypothetical protein